jgi:hypothetical protein
MPDRFKLGPLDVSMPHFVGVAVGILAVLSVSLWLWKQAEPLLFDDHIDLPAFEHTQMIEAQTHILEIPSEEWVFEDGEGEAKHFDSDHCVMVVWHDDIKGDVVEFMLHPARTFDQAELRRGGLFAEPLLAGGGDYCPEGRCWEPPEDHPGRFRYWMEPHGICSGTATFGVVWYEFEDYCRSWQSYDQCTGEVGPLVWSCCNH